MDASIFEWLFFGGPVELMIGVPIAACVVAVIYAVIKTAIQSVIDIGKKSAEGRDEKIDKFTKQFEDSNR